MTPYEQTVADWQARPRKWPLAFCEEQHKQHGFAFYTPTIFVLGRPVKRGAPIEQILDITHVFDFAECDTWFIFWLAGEPHHLWRLAPWGLPFICWQHAYDPTGELFFYEIERFMKFRPRE